MFCAQKPVAKFRILTARTSHGLESSQIDIPCFFKRAYDGCFRHTDDICLMSDSNGLKMHLIAEKIN